MTNGDDEILRPNVHGEFSARRAGLAISFRRREQHLQAKKQAHSDAQDLYHRVHTGLIALKLNACAYKNTARLPKQGVALTHVEYTPCLQLQQGASFGLQKPLNLALNGECVDTARYTRTRARCHTARRIRAV
jgi:hypothetical protein